MMPQMSDKTYIVAYGYDQTFNLTENEAEALITAREKGLSAIRLSRGSLSTAYSWVMPKWEVESERLNEEELKMAEMVGKWLARPVHDLDFTPESAMRYAKKTVKKIGCGQVKKLWDVYANGAYPSAKKFLMEARETSAIQAPALPDET